MDTLRLKIFQTTHSITTAKYRFGLVKAILEELLFADNDDSSAAGTVPTVIERYGTAVGNIDNTADREAIEAWGTDWLARVSANSFNAQVDSIESWLKSLPVLKLYVPVAFDDEAHTLIGQWCRKELGDLYMVETEVDGAMIGGCGFIKEDVFYEYNFASYLAGDSGVIQDVFKEYGTA